VGDLVLLPLILLPLSLHQLKPSLHEGVVVSAIKLQLSADKVQAEVSYCSRYVVHLA
jgi:hypothetical protein